MKFLTSIHLLMHLLTCSLLVLTFALPQTAAAKTHPKLLCTGGYGLYLKDRLPHPSSDKMKHCTLSCWLARRCSSSEVMFAGIAKEVADALGLGHPEWADLVADARGIRASYGASNDRHCLLRCRRYYP